MIDTQIGDFKEFIVKNGVVTAAIAITIGVSTAGFIKAFVSSILMPLVYFIVGKLFLEKVNTGLFKGLTDIFGAKTNFDVIVFLQEFLTWVFVVIGAYLIIEHFVRRWFLGVGVKVNSTSLVHATSPASQIYVTSVDPTPDHNLQGPLKQLKIAS